MKSDHHQPNMPDVVPEPIAVVGMAARLSGDATSVESFWQLLCSGRSTRTEIPLSRFNTLGYYSPTPGSSSIITKHGHFLRDDISHFDASFFGISPAEASCMDPQQRLLMETAYHAFENGGITLTSLAGSSTSVYIAAPPSNDYNSILHRDTEQMTPHIATGSGLAMMANRISHFFDLRSESMVVDTACSSGLHAISLACQNLRSGNCDMSLIGGGNLILTPETFMIPLSSGGFLSPDGVSYSFDARANGYARGEGFCAIVLKTLSRAQQDGDSIRAVIRACATGTDGRTSSITSPNATAQASLIRQAYESCDLRLDETSFVEAHATGTAVGDPIEAMAIGDSFATLTARKLPLVLGAVKTNIGHLEGASGLAAIIKTVLILERGLIPPVSGFQTLNPEMQKGRFRHFEIPTKLLHWPESGQRQASVNNFGYGGANSHVILQNHLHQAEQRTDIHEKAIIDAQGHQSSMEGLKTATSVQGRPRLLFLSSADEEGIPRLMAQLQSFLNSFSDDVQRKDDFLDRLCYTLSERRSILTWSAYAIVKSFEEARSELSNLMTCPMRIDSSVDNVFVFTGQGAQYRGMGWDLMEYTVFRQSVHKADDYLQQLGCSWSVLEEMSHNASELIGSPSRAQPLSTILQVALVDLLASLNVFPVSCIGHSSGEVAAAYCAGAVTRESAWRISFLRGQASERALYKSKQAGEVQGMMAVALSPSKCEDYIVAASLSNTVSIACFNSPINCTVSGIRSELEHLKALLDSKGIFARILNVTLAYHSTFMERAAEEVQDALLNEIHAPRGSPFGDYSPLYSSTISGTFVPNHELTRSSYWASNMSSPVRFNDGLSNLIHNLNEGVAILEIGPHAVLKRPVQETLNTNHNGISYTYSSVLRQGFRPMNSLLEVVGQARRFGNANLLAANRLSSGIKMLSNLPPYPFNHTQSHWAKSRIDRLYRSNAVFKHNFLGQRELDWNNFEPTWRNVIKVKQNPWVLDHTIGNSPVFPAAGYLIMAIEAVRQLLDNDASISAYRIRDVSYLRVLPIVETDEGTEICLRLRPHSSRSVALPRFDFRVFGLATGDWFEVCNGQIQAEPHRVEPDLSTAETRRWLQEHQEITQSCQFDVAKGQFYENLYGFGFQYGPLFQNLDEIKYSKAGAGAAKLLRSRAEADLVEPILLHPATLDAILHLVFVGRSRGGWLPIPPMMAARTTDIWLSTDLLKGREPHDNDELWATCTQGFEGFREFDSSVKVINSRTGLPVIQVLNHQAMSLGKLEAIDLADSDAFFTDIRWRPQFPLSTAKECQRYFDLIWKDREGLPEHEIIRANAIANYYIADVMSSFDITTLDLSKPHLSDYVKWLQLHYQSGKLAVSDFDIVPMIARPETLNPYARLALKIGQSLTPILRGQLDALSILFDDDLLEECYAWGQGETAIRIADYVSMLTHTKHGVRILEVGAGTGSATGIILAAISDFINASRSVPQYLEYCFTDISPAFLTKAKEKLSKFAKVKFCTLDISQPPKAQGFEGESYDLIIATNVIHATPDLSQTFQNIAQLLRPGGKLIFSETMADKMVAAEFAFGLLPGWWYHQQGDIPRSPLRSRDEWHQLLLANGFSGREMSFQDSDRVSNAMVETFISTIGSAPERKAPTADIIVIYRSVVALQRKIAESLQQQIPTCSLLEAGSARITTNCLTNQVVIVLLDVATAQSSLQDMKELDIDNLKTICLHADHTLWIAGGVNNSSTYVGYESMEGFAKTVNYELARECFTSVIFDDLSGPASAVNHICNLLYARDDSTLESTYRERQGLLCIPRIVVRPDLNLRSNTEPLLYLDLQDNQIPRAAAELRVESAGLLDSLNFIETDLLDGSLTSDHIDIQVHYAGLNFKDLLIALGQVPESFIGYDAAGVVVATGPGASFRVGDRVLMCGQKALATICRCPSSHAYLLPPDMDLSTAASLPTVAATAYYSLITVANLQKDEKVLIHSGAGGVGQMAIQIAQMLRADIFVTVGSEEKRRLLERCYGIPRKRILNSRDASFASDIRSMIGAQKIDVVLNSVSGILLELSLELVAPFGRFIELGKLDIRSNAKLSMSVFDRSVSFTSIDLGIPQARANVRRSIEAVMTLFNAQKDSFRAPQPIHIFPASQVQDAFRSLQTGRMAGKHVVRFLDDRISVKKLSRPESLFDPSSTYLVAGGLGGIGISIVDWMLTYGARHIAVLSRSGSSRWTQKLKLVFARAAALGATVTSLQCDIGDNQALQAVVSQLQGQLPAIRGCIQTTMVTRDAFLDQMSAESWHAVLRPKVSGSWNLHSVLPEDLDFFIMLGSLSSIHGNRGASSYAAANAYQDELAGYRVASGRRGLTLSLPVIRGIGFMAHEYVSLKKEAQLGHLWINETQFLGVLENACRLQKIHPERSRLVVAAPTPSRFLSTGRDLPSFMHDKIFTHLFNVGGADRASSGTVQKASTNVAADIHGAKSAKEATGILLSQLRSKLAGIMQVPEAEVNSKKPLYMAGVDSLVAIEIRHWLLKELKVEVATKEFLSDQNMENLCSIVVEKIRNKTK